MLKAFILFCISTALFAQESNWTNESELSLIQTGGNSSLETYNTQTEFKLATEKRAYSFGGHYTLGSSEQIDAVTGDKETIESARNWDGHIRYEQTLSQKMSAFLAVEYEGNEFAGYKQRRNTDLGAKYQIVKTDKVNSFFELGLRHTFEQQLARNTDDEDAFNYSKGRIFYEFSRKSTETLSYKFWTEYLPNFTESEDYLIIFEPSLAFVLSDTFSLKTAYKGFYDNQPSINSAGDRNKYLDYAFTTSLLANF